jgi:1-acyl-sn-glycerol-3-phosphate acyltransferase
VLKTSSGKIRRSATRDAYLRGEVLRGRASATAQWARLLLKETVARVGRLFSRAGGLVYAAYVGVLVAVTVPPLWALLLVMPQGRAARRLVRFWCRAILDFSCCPVRVEGLERLRAAVPAVLASNHASYLDAVVLFAALRTDFTFVAKRELASAPFVGRVLRKIGSMTVDRADPVRSVADAERATAVLRGGGSLLFFPEGTFVRTPGLLPFRLGAFKAAVEASRPVIPIGLRGTRDVLPDGVWLPRRGPITVSIGPAATPEAGGWQEMVRLRDLTRDEIARLTDEPTVHGRALTWASSARDRVTARLR